MGRHRGPGKPGGSGKGTGFSLRPRGPGCFEVVHPPCVARLWDDYEDALEAWRAGEPEEARDMLRFALEGCGDHVWIHCALGQIALEVEDNPGLARGHFGYALELVERALPRGFSGRLPGDLPGNKPVYLALDGLIACARADGNTSAVSELSRMRSQLSGASGESARPRLPPRGNPPR